MNWILEEAQKADPRINWVKLENPHIIAKLDKLLITAYYPPLKKCLDNCGYNYSSYGNIELETEFTGPYLARKLTIMLFDEFSHSFFRGYLSITETGYFLNREFFLSLPDDTDPRHIKRILCDKKFMGNYPVLHMEQEWFLDPPEPPQYHITLTVGSGMSTGAYSLKQIAITDMQEIISTSIKMFEVSRYGFDDPEDLDEFLKLAYTCYEAC